MILNKTDQEFLYKGKRFYIGQQIVATKCSEYEGLIGVINEIRDGDDKDDTDNETPDIYCSFTAPKMPYDIEKLEERFSKLYGEAQKVEDIALDLVIMAPEMIETPEGDFPKEKVFLVIEDWAHDDDRGSSYLVTTSLEEAKKQMRIIFENELENGFLSDQLKWNESFIVDSGELCYNAYEDGYADAEHYILYIEEHEMATDSSFMERLATVCCEAQYEKDYYGHIQEKLDHNEITQAAHDILMKYPASGEEISTALSKNDSYRNAYWQTMSNIMQEKLSSGGIE